MARPLRIEYPGEFYHVMHRGNRGSAIFKSKRDREKLFEYFDKAVERFHIKIHTYCLMTNHYHLLVETPQPNLSQAIKWINGSYAMYFNRKRKLSGHLFQGRFKAVLVDADEYLKHLSRYIHLNPVRAGIVESVKDYPWSSYPCFSGYKKAPEWLETQWLLSLFGKKLKKSKIAYRKFTEDIHIDSIENPAKDLVAGFILGNADYVNWIKKTFLRMEDDSKEKPQLKQLKPSLLPEDIVKVVTQEFNCDPESILDKGKKKNLARDVSIYLSRKLTAELGVVLGQYFGGISGAAVTVRYKHISQRLSADRRLRRRIKRIRKRIINN